MPESNDRSTANEERFNQVLARILQAEEAGKRVDLEKVVRVYPDLESRLRSYFRDRDEFGRVADALAPAPSNTPVPPDLAAGSQFAGYEIVKKLGQGGMGVVYLARQLSARRPVALKLIRPDQLARLPESERRKWISRFRTEARANARIADEGVVPVYEVGEVDGRVFYSMRYVPGQSLASMIEKRPLPNQRAARLMQQVARAVQVVHDHKITHRDLKPHNILVDENGRPYLSDFGLAKWEEASESLTHTGMMLGSAPFLSPEQAEDAAHVTTATDVYGLGATLYAVLTGRPPFSGKSLAETLHQVKYREPVPPRRLNSSVARDLETITLKCLEKKPQQRFASAAEVAKLLKLYLEGRPLPIRPIGPAGRLWRWCLRNRVVSTVSAAAAILLLTAGIVVAVKSVAQSKAERDKQIAMKGQQEAVSQLSGAKEGEQKARAGEQKAKAGEEQQAFLKLQAEYPDDMRQAGEAWYSRNFERVQELLAKHDAKPGRDDHRGWEWHYLKAYTASLEPGGKKAAVPRMLMADAPGGAAIGPQEAKAPPLLTWLKDETRLSILNPDGEFFVWNPDTQARIQFTLHPPTEAVVVEDAVWAPDGKRVASRSPDGTHHIWDAVTGQRLFILEGHTASKMPLGLMMDEGRLAWNKEGGLLAAHSQDNQVTIWDTKTGKVVFTEGAPPRNPDWTQTFTAGTRSRPSWSPDGKLLACCRLRFLDSKDPLELVLVEGTTGKAVPVPSKTFENPPPPGIIGGGLPKPLPLFWRPDSKYLACFLEPPFPFGTGGVPGTAKEAMSQQANAKYAGTIVVLDSQTGKEVYRAQGSSPSWSPDGKYLIIQRAEGDRVVDFETEREMQHPKGRVLAWSRDGKRMALFTGEISSLTKLGVPLRPGETQVPQELHLRNGELTIIDVAVGKSIPVLRLGDPRKAKPRPKLARGAGMIGSPPGPGLVGLAPGPAIPGAAGGIGGLGGPGGNPFQPTTVSTWVVERWCPDLKWVALE
jgi:tRNA A-37 threonylcarbamoyl transferase component Bud32